MERGQTVMHEGRAARVLDFGSRGVRVFYLSSGSTGWVPAAELRDPREPDAAGAYNTGLTPGRVPQ